MNREQFIRMTDAERQWKMMNDLKSATAEFAIPEFDEQVFTYLASGVADDDRIGTIVYKLDGTTVATLTFTYVGATNNVATIVRS